MSELIFQVVYLFRLEAGFYTTPSIYYEIFRVYDSLLEMLFSSLLKFLGVYLLPETLTVFKFTVQVMEREV